MPSVCRVAATLVLLAGATAAMAADWPHFRGPQGDGICPETGLLAQWPEGGPKLLWKMTGLGTGYSTVSIVGNRLYTTGDRGSPKAQCVLAFDLPARKLLWATPIGSPHKDGPRSTPTVDGERLYAIGTDGVLACVNTSSGELVWKKGFSQEFGGKMMSMWKFSESPLVDGKQVVCTPGGIDATIVALDKLTGETIWKCAVPELGSRGKDGAGYSSIVVAEIAGVRQYVQNLGRGVVGVEAATGKFLWGYNRVACDVANIANPVVRGDYVFATNSYKTGCCLLKIVRQGEAFKAEEVWWKNYTEFANHHGGVVLVGDYLYGGDGQNQGRPTCLDFMTGKIAWKGEEGVGGGSAAVLFADGRLWFRYQDGLVALLEATPKGLSVKGKFTPPEVKGQNWPHPVICDGKLYLRAQDTLMCYDVRAGE